MCEYCGKEHGNTPLVERGSRIVEIEKANERTWGIFMRWRTQNGKLHMEWSSIGFCPNCGREFNPVQRVMNYASAPVMRNSEADKAYERGRFDERLQQEIMKGAC